MLGLFPQEKCHKYDMNHYLVFGVHYYLMISCNAFRLNLKSLTLKNRVIYKKCCLYFLNNVIRCFAIL
jgi:hypothetical protein